MRRDVVDAEFYRGLLDHVSDGVYFVTRDRHITYWNIGAEQITGYTAGEVVGRSCSEGILRHVNEQGRQLCLHGCPLAGVMKDGRPREAHVYLHHKDGHRVPVTIRGQALRDSDGVIVGSVEVFTARVPNLFVDQRRATADESQDPVTGLLSRRPGELQLQALTQAVTEGATGLGVLFVDVDHFKSVNDTFGHRTGDDVLQMVARSLASGLRRGDVPIRWGGEEFLILLPGADTRALQVTAERVRMLVENSWIQRGDLQARVTVSIGATLAVPGEPPKDLVDRSDRHMYASKRAGRNRVTADGCALVSHADRPILGTGIPWEMPELQDVDGFGTGAPR